MNIKEKECVTNISLEVIWAMPERKVFSYKRFSLITERLFLPCTYHIALYHTVKVILVEPGDK